MRLTGPAWGSSGVEDAYEILDQLDSGYALRITYTAKDDGHVWVCMPHSKAGWTGIGQQNPIKRDGYIYIPYDVVAAAAGYNRSSWGEALYIKGNADWTITKIEVVRWID